MEMESWKGNNQWKMLDEGYNVNMHIIFYGMTFLDNILNPSAMFRYNNQNSLIEQS